MKFAALLTMLAAAAHIAPSAIVTGKVLVCNVPGHCLTRVTR